jgi:hypothetical protein
MTAPVEIATPLTRRLSALTESRWFVPVLTLVIALGGLGLRVEHALTFDGPERGSDYLAYMKAVQWVLDHGAPFDARAALQVNHYPPLWFVLAALMLKVGFGERALAFIAVTGWAVRHVLLGRLLAQAAPQRPWSRLLALAAEAFLPLSVLMSGKVNPEGLHATLFFVALYFLWRIERRLAEAAGPRWQELAWFGFFAGLAMLTKPTAGVLVPAALLLLAWYVFVRRRASADGLPRRRLLRLTAVAALAMALPTGWYFGNNLARFGSPAPSPYTPARIVSALAGFPAFREPVLYRRPLGWFLPLDPLYLKHPMGFIHHQERPNFWGTMIAGTWGDYCNRGLCRLGGGQPLRYYWGGWDVSERCIGWLRAFVGLGAFLSLLTAAATVAVTVRFFRSAGRHASLVLPLAPVLVFAFIMVFATVYPFDRGEAVVKANYVLAATTPLAACCGLALADISWRRRLVHAAASVLVAVVAFLLVFERFG